MFNLLKLREKENLLGIDNVTLSQLIASGKLVHISNCDKMAKCGKWANDIRGCNRYYRIIGTDNMVLLLVEDNYGCIIPEYVEYKGNKINIVKMLSKCHWTINEKNNNNIKGNKGQYLYRVIWAVKLYGDSNQKVNDCYTVHHKLFRWWNTIESTSFMREEKHRKHHTGNGKSHRQGFYFEKENSFVDFVNELKRVNEIIKNREM